MDSDQALYERALRKHARLTRRVEQGLGTDKDQKDVAELALLLPDFQQTFAVAPVVAAPGARRTTRQQRSAVGTARGVPGAFNPSAAIKAPDRVLEGSAVLPAGRGYRALHVGLRRHRDTCARCDAR